MEAEVPGDGDSTARARVWTDERVVLKPVGFTPEHDWVCEVYAVWSCDDVRVPEPLRPSRAPTSCWSVYGWGAAVFAGRNRLMGSLVTHLERVRPVAEVVLARAGGG